MTIVAEEHPSDGRSTAQSQAHPVVGETAPKGDGSVFARRHLAVWEHAIEDWSKSLRGRRQASKTIYQRRWQLRKLMEEYGHRSPWKLTTTDLEVWLGQPAWDRESAKSARSALRSFYGWAVKTKRAKHDPAYDLESVRVSRGVPRPARDNLVERVLSEVDDRTRLMIVLAYWAGLRVAEIASLRWDNVDVDSLIIKGKGDHEREIPLHALVSAELERWRTIGRGTGRYSPRSDDWVFPGRLGKGLHPGTVSRILSAALGNNVTGHKLRHGFAQRVLDKTGDLAATQELLGHADPATTRIYASPSGGAKRAAIDAL